MPDLGGVVTAGLRYLAAVQQPDGSFVSSSSPALRPFKATKTYHTTFVPAVMLGAVSATNRPQAKRIKKRLATWLVGQKSSDWSFNYWAAQAPERADLPYPDDLDDTFCALIGLQLYDPSLIGASGLAKAVRLLVAAESQVGGPYRTWLVASGAPGVWQDIDLAVNANIAYFLQLVAEPLPNLTTLMQKAITAGRLASPYYPSWQPIAYYLSRAYQGQYSKELVRFILKKRRSGYWGNPLNSALAVTALLRLGHTAGLEPAITYLCSQQQADGSWPADAFCLDPAQKSKQFFHGGAALTTALAIESLELFSKRQPLSVPHRPKPKILDKDEKALYAQVLKTARRQLGALDHTLRKTALARLEALSASSDSREIVLLPLWFARSLRQPLKLPPAMLVQLGMANLYGWLAYDIYDDFLDEEGDPSLLSVANVAMRYSLAAFQSALPTHPAFQAKVLDTFDRIDSANAWEVAHCRLKLEHKRLRLQPLPTYGRVERLAERSIGHALTPVGVLAAAGLDLESDGVRAIETAITHYLTARQLNDDAHDWQEDISRGHSTYVVTKLLTALDSKDQSPSLGRLTPRLERQFWVHSLLRLCQTISRQTRLSRQAAAKSQLLQETNVLTLVTEGIDSVVARTLAEHANATNFLKAYRS
jgi:hypothetical protein